MNNNPISINDALGDTVWSTNKSNDKTFLDWIAQGLKLSEKQKNPFSFDDNGKLKFNKKAFKALSNEQKSIADPLKGMMKNQKSFELTGNSRKDEGLKISIGGQEKVFSMADIGGGKTSGFHFDKELGKFVTDITIALEPNPDRLTGQGSNGQDISDPNYAIFFREVGHAYYRDIIGTCDQQCKAIDYENQVRQLNNLDTRDAAKAFHLKLDN
jgi:hypothetical protein